jgi:hypothetical protein
VVAPGVKVFFPQPPGAQFFPNDRRVVRATLATGAPRAVKYQPLPTVALDDDATRTPSIDRAEWHLLSLIAPLEMLDNFHLLPSFPQSPARVACYC